MIMATLMLIPVETKPNPYQGLKQNKWQANKSGTR